ncbi:MFS transporter, partial [Flavobacterium chungangensis]
RAMTNPPLPVAATVSQKDVGFREFVVLSACLMAMNALSTDPMLPALPDIGRDLAIEAANDRQLIISTYFLGLGIGSLLFGVLSDRFGRKPVLGGAFVAALDHVDGRFQLADRELAHADDFAGEAGQLVVVALDDVFFAAAAHGVVPQFVG